MKKYIVLIVFLLNNFAFAQPLSECIPYDILYGNELIFDLNQEPILKTLKQDLAQSNLLGNIPSFSLFKQSFNQVFYS